MKNAVRIILAFVIGLVLGLSVSMTVRTIEGYNDADMQATVAAEIVARYVPTPTPHDCPPLEICEVCPYYKALPNVTGVLSDLGLVDYEMSLVDTKLENYIGSTEGEYDWALVGILSLHRSTHNYLLDAADEIIYWYNLGYMTCP